MQYLTQPSLPGNPTTALQAAPKQYVDNALAPGTLGLPRLQLRQNTGQSIPITTDTALIWDTQLRQTGGATWWTSGTTITLPWQGSYDIDVWMGVPGTDGSGTRRALHWVQGTVANSTSNFLLSGVAAASVYEYGWIPKIKNGFYNPTAGQQYVVSAWHDMTSAGWKTTPPWASMSCAGLNITFLGP